MDIPASALLAGRCTPISVPEPLHPGARPEAAPSGWLLSTFESIFNGPVKARAGLDRGQNSYQTYHKEFNVRLYQKTLFMFFCGFFCLVMQLAPLGALQAREGASPQTRQITDQLNRTVTIPDKVQRSVVLMHHALDIAIQLGAQDRIVGVLQKWPEMLPDAVKAMPRLRDMPMPGELSSVNMESLLQLKPDVVILTDEEIHAMELKLEDPEYINAAIYRLASIITERVLNGGLDYENMDCKKRIRI